MSFGRPPTNFTSFSAAPPDRGSFPLDHDGECKGFMREYLKCLKASKNNNGECRLQSRNYLDCRMSKELMERDDFSNLGLGDVDVVVGPNTSAAAVPPKDPTSTPTS